MIEVNNISYHYHGGKDVLKDVSFALEQGQFLAILGNNGVGKSTLLKCLNKILRADSGQVLLDGENILQMSNHQVSRRMAFVAQTVPSTQMTVHDVVMLGRRPYMKFGFTEKDHQIVHSAMDRLNLDPLRGRFLNQLSGGERQRISIARAILKDAPVILLDEATASLDVENETAVQAALSGLIKDKTVLIIAHRMRTVMNADQIVLLSGGRVAEMGSPAELLKKNGLFRHMAQLQSESMEWTA